MRTLIHLVREFCSMMIVSRRKLILIANRLFTVESPYFLWKVCIEGKASFRHSAFQI
jgi:hypothetical protein